MKSLSPAAAFLIVAMSCVATPVTITNPSFDTPATNGIATPSGWTLFGTGGGRGSYNPFFLDGGNNAFYVGANSTTAPSAGGSGYAGILGSNLAFGFRPALNNTVGLYQTLVASLLDDMVYTLSIRAFRRNGTGPSGTDGFAGSTLTLFAGTTEIGSVTDLVGPAAGGFVTQTLVVNSSALSQLLFGQALRVQISTARLGGGSFSTDWDGIALDVAAAPTPVPEPSTLALFGMAIAGILWRRTG